MLRSADTKNLNLRAGPEAMMPYWKNIRVSVAYIQCEKDELIDTSDASFARQHLINTPYLDVSFLKNEPYFFPTLHSHSYM